MKEYVIPLQNELFAFYKYRTISEQSDSIRRKSGKSILCGSTWSRKYKKINLMTKEELERSIHFEIDENTVIVTYHPVTLEIIRLRSSS